MASVGLIVGLIGVLPGRAAESPVQIIGAQDPAAMKVPVVAGPAIWKDPTQPVAARVRDLVRRMTFAEKISQLSADAPAIPRLGIPAYSYRNECLHGVVTRGVFVTVFPQSIGMAATWDPALIHTEGDVVSTEARAIFNDYTHHHNGNSAIHKGLTFYAPNINLDRDPRWGRGQETYGEDPFLTAQMAVAYIRGLQGDNPKYMKTISCPKHFVAYSGPEPLRHRFDARPPERDLYDTYLPAFEAAIREGHAGGIMGAYSALYGEPDCADPFLLIHLLRERWGFQGYVVSDGDAIVDIWAHHKYVRTPEAAAGVAVDGGCDLFSGGNIVVYGPRSRNFAVLGRAAKAGWLSEGTLDRAIRRTFTARFRLGLFDPPNRVPWSNYTLAQDDTPAHRALALKVAQESIVLLKNNGLLPLDRAKIKRVAVIGANAKSERVLLGNYNGLPSHPVTILAGLKRVLGPEVQVVYQRGCPLALKRNHSNQPSAAETAKTVAAAKSADVVIYVGGLDSSLEKEEGRVDAQGFLGGDRTRIELPSVQEQLLRALQATGKPVVFVNCSGSAIALPWAIHHLAAIVQAWYPGEEGGLAVAQVLFGMVNPSGRLPITFYRSTKDLPPFTDYAMRGRTYRYFLGQPEFAFGYGLSYTTYAYRDGQLNAGTFHANDTAHLAFTVQNTGQRAGDEVAQVYYRRVPTQASQAQLTLCAFKRIHLTPGQTTTVTLDVPLRRLRQWNTNEKQYVVQPGAYELLVGGASDALPLRAPFKVIATR